VITTLTGVSVYASCLLIPLGELFCQRHMSQSCPGTSATLWTELVVCRLCLRLAGAFDLAGWRLAGCAGQMFSAVASHVSWLFWHCVPSTFFPMTVFPGFLMTSFCFPDDCMSCQPCLPSVVLGFGCGVRLQIQVHMALALQTAIFEAHCEMQDLPC